MAYLMVPVYPIEDQVELATVRKYRSLPLYDERFIVANVVKSLPSFEMLELYVFNNFQAGSLSELGTKGMIAFPNFQRAAELPRFEQLRGITGQAPAPNFLSPNILTRMR